MRACRRIPLAEYPARRIALIKPSSLGDIVHSLPVLTALRRRFPEAHISWVINRGYEPLLCGHPDLDATLPFDRKPLRGGWGRKVVNFSRFLRRLRQEQFDLVIDLQGLLRSGLMAAFSGATRRVGLSTAREGATWYYSDIVHVNPRQDLHAVDRYWLVARALGAGDGPKEFRVPVPETERRWAEVVLQGYPRPWLMVGLGSRWQTKRWPPHHFAALLRLAQERFGGTAVFVGGGDETGLAQAALGKLSGPGVDLTGRTTLPQLAAILSRADVLVANDTGPLHLGAALGRPVVAPYTCTRISRSGPYGAEGNARETEVRCRGSYRKHCDRLECMDELTPARLWPVLLGVLLAWEKSNPTASSWPVVPRPAGTC